MEPVDQFIAISGLLHDRSTEVENVGWSQELEEKCFTKADLQKVKDQFPDIYKKFRFPYVDANPGDVLLYTTEDVTKNRSAYKAGLAAKNDVLKYVNKLLKTAAEDKLNTDNELVIESLINSTNDSLFAGYPHELELCDDTGVLRRRSGFQAKCVDLGAGEFMNQLVQGKPSLSKDSGGALVGTGCYFHFRPRTASDSESVLSDKNGNVATPNAAQSMAFISGKLLQLDWSFQSFRGKPVLSKLVLTEMDKASEDQFRKFKGEGCSASFTRIIAARDSHQRKIAANNANNPDAG
jgi:hypothetical protein